jgi:ABC-type dipeptide/oligopeptide/nickel transport system ATPase subunit
MAQYVFSMNHLGKIVPPKRHILKDISLSFFPGAKIGVLGVNGSGKSTLLKIMAGVDKEFEGEAIPMPGLKIGYLPQEPKMDPEQTVREAVESGMGEVRPPSSAWTRFMPPTLRRTPISTPWLPSRPSSKPSSPRPAMRPSINWKSPPTRCACRPGKP